MQSSPLSLDPSLRLAPRPQSDLNSLWLMGNAFIASTREIVSNYLLIANQTLNNFMLNRDWQYMNLNGAYQDQVAQGGPPWNSTPLLPRLRPKCRCYRERFNRGLVFRWVVLRCLELVGLTHFSMAPFLQDPWPSTPATATR